MLIISCTDIFQFYVYVYHIVNMFEVCLIILQSIFTYWPNKELQE